MAASHSPAPLFVEGVPCHWISTWEEVEAAVLQLRDADYVAVDVEGASLGHNGRAATIQLCAGGANLPGPQVCYIIDLPAVAPATPGTSNQAFPDSLRWLLESGRNTIPPGPLKVCHSFDGDQINLIEQFNLDFSKADLFDTQVALKQLKGKGKDEYTKLGMGLLDVLTEFGSVSGVGITPGVATEMRALKGGNLRHVDFFARPLPENIIRYMCLDVLYLGLAQAKLRELLTVEAGTCQADFESLGGGVIETDKQFDNLVLAGVLEASRYLGPYGKGDCYRPPTEKQKERQLLKRKVWCEETRNWVKQSG